MAAFVRQAPGRRAARALLCSGPIVCGCWAASLVVGRAWVWPVPAVLRLVFGVTLVGVIAMVVLAATGRRSYRRTRIAASAGVGLIGLDARSSRQWC